MYGSRTWVKYMRYEHEAFFLFQPHYLPRIMTENANCDIQVSIRVQVRRLCAGNTSYVVEQYDRLERIAPVVAQQYHLTDFVLHRK